MAEYQGGRCHYWQQYPLHAHSHVIGTDCVNHADLTPSAVLCVVFFLAAIGFGVKWHLWQLSRFYITLVVASSMFFTGLAFAIRAGIANTNRYNVARSAVIAEQIFFVTGELVLIGSHVTIAYEGLKEQALGGKKWVYGNYALLFISFILNTVAFALYSPPPTRPDSIPLRGTQLRIAGSVFPFLLTLIFNPGWLLYGKNKSPKVPGFPVGFALVVVVDVLLIVPALYIGFGVVQLLAAVPFAMPLSAFNFGIRQSSPAHVEQYHEGDVSEEEDDGPLL
ncbi:hypothetical protein RQP46_000058 [Phenoliferia psychrophenolica]